MLNLALVHDYLNQRGGAERVVEIFAQIFSGSPIYTSFYIEADTFPAFKEMKIITSFMQKFPGVRKNYKKYLMFYPRAFESFDLSGFDVVLSSSSAFAKGVRVGGQTLHICYCHTPARFIWMFEDYIRRENLGWLTIEILRKLIKKLKKWDLENSARVNYFIANSKLVAERIKKFYGRDSTVIYPPIDISKFKVSEGKGDYFLIVSRLVTPKRIEVAVEAFNRLKLPLKIAGYGPDLPNLQKQASAHIEFLGVVSDNKLGDLYASCRALVFPGLEDFGLVPLEAQACGRPVLAYGVGGALETVKEGETGLFFKEQTADSLIEVLEKFDNIKFDANHIRQQVAKFDLQIFNKAIFDFVLQKYKEFKRPC